MTTTVMAATTMAVDDNSCDCNSDHGDDSDDEGYDNKGGVD